MREDELHLFQLKYSGQSHNGNNKLNLNQSMSKGNELAELPAHISKCV